MRQKMNENGMALGVAAKISRIPLARYRDEG